MKKFPKFSQWKQLFKILKGTERKFFLVLASLTFLSAIYLVINFYISNTIISPAYGGTYIEGVIGQPRFINPIYGETNDVDRTLIDLVYSGLMRATAGGDLIPDLAQSYNISSDGLNYTFKIRRFIYYNLFWRGF